ncbi:hypothetical protein R83H12_03064 [Fibrobacteria bacterium R8-3-H12]
MNFHNGKRIMLAVCLGFALLLAFSCADLGRDNPNDPGSDKYVSRSSSSSEEFSSSSETSSSSTAKPSSSSAKSSSSVSNSSSSVELSSGSSADLCAIFSSSSTHFCDSRDGKTYEWIKIGDQYWMAKNLNYYAMGSRCYGGDSINCEIYGRLYDCATATLPQSNHKGICPTGWHIPSDAEWDVLESYVGGSSIAGAKLKSSNDWRRDNDNTYGFSALPGGGICFDEYCFSGTSGFWWSVDNCHNRAIYIDDDKFYHMDTNENLLLSVRCVKD